MYQRIKTPDRIEAARTKIAALFAGQPEWFCTVVSETTRAQTTRAQNTQSLRRSEMDIAIAHGRLIFTCWTEKGSRTWKVFAWEWTGEKLKLQASRKMGAERPVIELVPRAAATAIALTFTAARQTLCDALAHLASSFQQGAKEERSMLSPG